MSNVTLSAATRQNLLSLQDTANLLSTTQNRLSTGKKVNSALDNPTNFFTSQALTGRSSDLSSLLDGISNGVQAIQAANQGITSIQKLVDSAKSTAQQAIADKSGSGSGAAGTGAAAQKATLSGKQSYQTVSATAANALNANADGTKNLSSLDKDASLDISLDGGTTYQTLRLDSSTLKGVSADLTKVSSGDMVSALNNQISNNASLKDKISASITSDGRITFTTTDTGVSSKLNVRAASGSNTDIGFDVAATGTAAAVTGTGTLATNFSGANAAALTVSDGVTSVKVQLDSNSKKADGSALGAAAAPADLVDALNVQLKAAGSSVKADVNTGQIRFTSSDLGSSSSVLVKSVAATGSGLTDVDIGYGAATGGPFAGVGTGAAGTAVATAIGSDPTDGSSKAKLTGTLPLSSTTVSATNDASFTIQLGSGTAKTIKLAAGTYATGQAVADAINTQLEADSGFKGQVKAGVDSSNRLTFTSTAYGADQKITVLAAQTTTGASNQIDLGFGKAAAPLARLRPHLGYPRRAIQSNN